MSDQVYMREVDLTGMFEEKCDALIEVERAKGGSGNGHLIETRRLDWRPAPGMARAIPGAARY